MNPRYWNWDVLWILVTILLGTGMLYGAAQLGSSTRPTEPQPVPVVRTARINSYTTFAQLQQHLGKPTAIFRQGNTTVLQYSDLNTEPTMWQIDVRISGGVPPVPKD